MTCDWHVLAHKISYAHRVMKELLCDLPASEPYVGLREALILAKIEAESNLIITPEQILKHKEE